MSSLTWSKPFQQSSASIDNRYWITNQLPIKATITHTPALIIPGIAEQRKISLMLTSPFVGDQTIIPVRIWINPPPNFISNNDESIVGHLWLYSGQNLTDWECSDPVWMATLEPSDTQDIVIKSATLSPV